MSQETVTACHKGTAFLDIISPCVTFNNHKGSTKSFDYVREHNRAVNRLDHLPARDAIGVAYHRGRFYYHAWNAVWCGSWIEVDPTFGQFPADAAHLRFAQLLHADRTPTQNGPATEAKRSEHCIGRLGRAGVGARVDRQRAPADLDDLRGEPFNEVLGLVIVTAGQFCNGLLCLCVLQFVVLNQCHRMNPDVITDHEFHAGKTDTIRRQTPPAECRRRVGQIEHDAGACFRDVLQCVFVYFKFGVTLVHKTFVTLGAGYGDFLIILQDFCCIAGADRRR